MELHYEKIACIEEVYRNVNISRCIYVFSNYDDMNGMVELMHAYMYKTIELRQGELVGHHEIGVIVLDELDAHIFLENPEVNVILIHDMASFNHVAQHFMTLPKHTYIIKL